MIRVRYQQHFDRLDYGKKHSSRLAAIFHRWHSRDFAKSDTRDWLECGDKADFASDDQNAICKFWHSQQAPLIACQDKFQKSVFAFAWLSSRRERIPDTSLDHPDHSTEKHRRNLHPNNHNQKVRV